MYWIQARQFFVTECRASSISNMRMLKYAKLSISPSYVTQYNCKPSKCINITYTRYSQLFFTSHEKQTKIRKILHHFWINWNKINIVSSYSLLSNMENSTKKLFSKIEHLIFTDPPKSNCWMIDTSINVSFRFICHLFAFALVQPNSSYAQAIPLALIYHKHPIFSDDLFAT